MSGGLLKSIVGVLGSENVKKLQNNLIFVGRTKKDEEASYSQTYMTIDGGQLPVTIVKTHNFAPVHEALDTVKRKIPAHVLRLCKEQLYEIVKTENPDTKICVVDIDKIENKNDVQFIVGVGVAKEQQSLTEALPGYNLISIPDLCHDVLAEEIKLDAERVLVDSLPLLGKTATYVPVYRYLYERGIRGLQQYKKSLYKADKHLFPDPSFYATRLYARQFVTYAKDKDAVTIILENPPEKAAAFLAFLPEEKFELVTIRDFLCKHADKFSTSANYSTYFRKLICLYDRYTYGWDFSVIVPEDDEL